MRSAGRPVWLAALVALPLSAAETGPVPGSTFRSCEACPEMVVIPGGSFVMGTPGAARGSGVAGAEAEPVAMRIERAFALGRHEVTRREYAQFVAESGHDPRPGCRTWDPVLARFNDDLRRDWHNPATPATPSDDHPVSCVSHADALAYARWLAENPHMAFYNVQRGYARWRKLQPAHRGRGRYRRSIRLREEHHSRQHQ